MAGSEQVSGENIERAGRVRKLHLSSVRAKPNNAAGPGHYRQGRARCPEQLDLYEEPSGAGGHPQPARPSRRKSAVVLRCPLCRSEMRVVAIALTVECPSCHAVVDVLEVAPVSLTSVNPSSRSPSSASAQIEPRLVTAKSLLRKTLPSFFPESVPITEASTAQTPAARRHSAPTVRIILGVAVLLGVVGIGCWQIYPKQGQMTPEIGAPLETPPIVASPVFPMVSQEPPTRLVVGLPQLGNKPPPDEPATPPVAEPQVATPATEAPALILEAAIPQAFVPANIVVGPADNVFVVRFDSKLPGLTPSGLRTLDGALRAANKGRKVHIEIAGCAAHDGIPTGRDCAALTRSLKSILAHRGVDHPADLIISQYPPPIMFPW